MIFVIEKNAVGDRELLTSELGMKWVEEGKAKLYRTEEELAQAYNKGEIPSNTEHIMFFEPNKEKDYYQDIYDNICNLVMKISPDDLSVDVKGYLERNDRILDYWTVIRDDRHGYPYRCLIEKISINENGDILIDARDDEQELFFEDDELYSPNDFEAVYSALSDIYENLDILK